MFIKLLSLLLFLFLFQFSIAQYAELHFTRLSVENGVPENYVTCSIQDKKGYVWFGTENGLVRYDGYNAKVYKLDTSQNQAYSVWSIMQDHNGIIWAGTFSKGIFKYNILKDNFEQFDPSLKQPEKHKQDFIFHLLEDKEGYIWADSYVIGISNHIDRLDPKTGNITTYDSNNPVYKPSVNISSNSFIDKTGNIYVPGSKGLFQFNYVTKNFTEVMPDYLSKKNISFIYETSAKPGEIWLTCLQDSESCLFRYNKIQNSIKIFKHNISDKYSLPGDSVFALHEDRMHRLWVATSKGLAIFGEKTESFTTYLPEHFNQSVHAGTFDIQEDLKGGIWLVTRKGLYYLPSLHDSAVHYVTNTTLTDGLPLNEYHVSMMDRDGLLWIGCSGRGFYRLNEKASQFEFAQKNQRSDSYPGGALISMAPINSQQYLFTTSTHQLIEYFAQTDSYQEVILDKNLKENAISNIVVTDKNGIAWIGTNNYGIYRYDPNSKKSINYKYIKDDSNSLPNNKIHSLYDDGDELWVGTNGSGLCKLNKQNGKVKRYPFTTSHVNDPNGVLDDDLVLTIYKDRKGTIWVGTNNGGLNRLDQQTERFVSYYDHNKRFECIFSIYEDSHERLWAGTYLGGLFLIDRQNSKVKNYTEKNGLLFNEVLFIKEDSHSKLWLGSERGLTVFDPQNYQVQTITKANGLPVVDFTPLISEINNKWVIGTKNGMILFNHGLLNKNLVAPEMVIQSISINSKNNENDSFLNWEVDQKINLRYFQNTIHFDYAGIQFSNPSLNKFAYKLEGYDKEWTDAGNIRSATFTNLSPGTYTFHVKSISSDGIWSQKDATFTFTISPPWWKTWWAYILFALTLFFIIRIYIYYRSKALISKNKLLEEKVNERTIQLQNSILNLKSTQQQLIQSAKMASLGELMTGIAHEIQNPLNFVNNFSEVNTELIEEMKEELVVGKVEEANSIADIVNKNMFKILHHGRRADLIVKNMLMHSRKSNGKKEPTQLNNLVEEYLKLSYHSLKEKDNTIEVNIQKHFDNNIDLILVNPQDIGRVLLNIFNNAFYAVYEKRTLLKNSYEPKIVIITKKEKDFVLIKITDNGTGIPNDILDKIFQPFFTTKPTGYGTGLGLSLSYDIVKAHSGELLVENNDQEGVAFIIKLPC